MPATGNPFAWLSSAEYLPQIRKLFPRGDAWPEDPDTTAEAMRQAIADSAAAVHTLGSTLVEIEGDPTQTLLLLSDWEKDWGLPDPCTPLNATIAQRRAALVGKIVSNAGGNLSLLAYLEAVAAAYGYTITARYGRATDGTGWQWLIVITAQTASTESFFRAGDSGAGDFLNTWNNSQLECVLRRITPAHKQLSYTYV